MVAGCERKLWRTPRRPRPAIFGVRSVRVRDDRATIRIDAAMRPAEAFFFLTRSREFQRVVARTPEARLRQGRFNGWKPSRGRDVVAPSFCSDLRETLTVAAAAGQRVGAHFSGPPIWDRGSEMASGP